jgi:arginyl-tRNA synthetase
MFWHTLKDHIAQRASAILGVRVNADEIILPPRPEMGDLALPCFRFAKEGMGNPAEVAKKIADEFGKDNRNIESAKAEGPFVNFTLRTGEFAHRVVTEVLMEDGRFAASDLGKHAKVLFEYAQPNTHKEMHVGHLRNLIIGASLVRILRHAGFDVVPMSYHGDVGSHVAKCLWWLVKKSRVESRESRVSVRELPNPNFQTPNPNSAMGLTIEEVDVILEGIPKEQQTGNFLGKLYTESTAEAEKDPATKEELSAVQRALEAHEYAWMKLWMETRRWSLAEFTRLFEELGVQIDRQYLESEVVDEGQRIVDELLAKKVAKEDQGAIIIDLEDVKLGVFLIRKSDGTSLYATKDLALAGLKTKEFPGAARSIVLVDNRQTLYFRQLFETLFRMGNPVEMEHIGYEFVTLKSGAMSSRQGNIVTYESFRDEIYASAWKQTKERHADWTEGQLTYVAWSLALAAMKFGMLKQDSDRVFVFDLAESLSFDGDTGPYVQYAAVRMNSILKKAGGDVDAGTEADCRILAEPQEKRLASIIIQLEDVVPRAARELKPSIIAQWCVEAARASNAFYRDVKVLDAPEDVKRARLRLVLAAKNALGLALGLLGIPVPEEM